MVGKPAFLYVIGLAVAALSASILIALTVVTPQVANAAVGNGGGGGGGGGTCNGGGIRGCPWTSNGQGWYKLSVNDPNAPQGNGFWAVASDACKAEGSSHVIAYVVLDGTRSLPAAWIYNYTWGFAGGGDPYSGNVDSATAEGMFNSVPDKQGHTFGVDVGWFCYNDAKPWNIDGQSYIQVGNPPNRNAAIPNSRSATAKPGDRVNWYHDLRNVGPQDMDKGITVNVDMSGFTNGFPANFTLANGASGPNGFLFWHNYADEGGSYSWFIVTQNDVGRTMCENVAWSPYSWDNNGWGHSNSACVSVPYNFNLSPSISVSPDVAEVDSTVTVSPSVNNAGPTISTNADWQVVRFNVPPAGSIPAPNLGNSAPISYYANGASIVSQGAQVFQVNATPLSTISQSIPNLAPGTRVCFALSVKPVSHADGRWSYGTPACVTVSIKPKVQILGGDLVVGRPTIETPTPASASVSTSSSFASSQNKYFGSWSEYAIIPSGTVRGMASGAMYVDGVTPGPGNSEPNLCTLSVLTITNSTASSCQAAQVGNYKYSTPVPDVESRFKVTGATGSADIKDLVSGTVYSVTGSSMDLTSSVTIGESSPGSGKGKWIVINDKDAVVTIKSNITYDNLTTFHQIDDIPQVVIIAKNILIDESVTNVDAWLIAVGTGNNGIINTCSFVPSGAPTDATLNSDHCSQKLTVNGPIQANKLYMYRTTPSPSGAPAEIFNLRADAFVWASAYSPGIGRVPTTSIKELPPRF